MESAGGSVLAEYVPEYLFNFVDELDEHPWLFACLASILVGLSGILPLLIIPIDKSASFKDGAGAATLKILLSFAVGGLLGDVFLHLLPEAWEHDLASTKEGEHVSLKCGLWCLFGMLVFIIVEKLFAASEEVEDDSKHNGSIKHIEIEEIEKLLEVERKQRKGEGICGGNGTVTARQLYDSCVFNNNTKGEGACCNSVAASNGALKNCKGQGQGRWMGRCLLREAREKAQQASKKTDKGDKKDVAGYLNLMANSIDNFTHGLAVGGSFLVGFRVGLLTTFAILVHEIPHEVGDFAILLKSGFSRWEAAKAQLATASAGLIGAMVAVVFSGAKNAIEAKTSWIVPFTAGGFLHIALVTVLPDLLREDDKRESLKHLAALVAGIAVMATMQHYAG
ncbi:zinc transporter ZIP13 homolog [Pectinophora gossypiella]|uniref:zinc transporter ZIP13 homolog n=1 Tax=Pectinophora gossypiella TaxID=13191 RepID=UPI00214E4848|nr:zinc transporter ZIP13 homolog [Pectinophora gossypiella]